EGRAVRQMELSLHCRAPVAARARSAVAGDGGNGLGRRTHEIGPEGGDSWKSGRQQGSDDGRRCLSCCQPTSLAQQTSLAQLTHPLRGVDRPRSLVFDPKECRMVTPRASQSQSLHDSFTPATPPAYLPAECERRDERTRIVPVCDTNNLFAATP